MFQLEHSGLRVSILDPIADKNRLGSRYCVGGYVWQVTDADKGELFAGPQFPDPEPRGFDGQGLPEVFEIALGQDQVEVGGEVWVIGVGRVSRESPVKPFHVRNNFTVLDFAKWDVDLSKRVCIMTSRQSFRAWDLQLTRRVSLEGRNLVSSTSVRNLGTTDLPLRWFAHPFFPHAGWEICRFSVECDLPRYLADAGGFRMSAKGFLERVPEHNWKAGCYQLLNLPFGYPIDIHQKHPALGEIKVECRFPLAWMPIWANERTVSIEAYHHTILPGGAQTEWSIRYGF